MRLSVQLVFAVAALLRYPGRCRRIPGFRPHRDVATPQGTVRGYLTPTHTSYLGIPYAHPPTRPHRYKAPEPPPTWDGIFEASHKIKCPQAVEVADENCLVVNVFAPRHHTLLPVYVLMHGGDFKTGWGPHAPSSQILKEGFVMVTFNYRLGALGFLCLGTEDALGNAGIKDQIAALLWINKSIKNFGGDPGDVILHGTRNAASSIQLLLLSGLINGLVHKIIVESDSALSPLSITYNPISIAYRGAVFLGYKGTTDTNELFNFYNKASWKDLATIPDTFYPCTENAAYTQSLITFDPQDRLVKGEYAKVPIMITYRDKIDIGNFTKNIDDNMIDNIADVLPINLAFDNNIVEQQVAQIVKEFYFGNGVYAPANTEKNYKVYKYDIFVEYPMVMFAMLYDAKSPYLVYLMKFETDGDNSIDDPKSGTILENLDRDGDDTDINLERLITMWSNFLKMGDPSPIRTNLIPIIWQPVDTGTCDGITIANVPTLHFGNQLKMSPPPKNQRLLFWYNIYNKFYKPHIIERDLSEDL